MGRKKKKSTKPWCWYCNREFEDEKILLQHQKAKHFKCHICHKKLYTGPGLQIHCMQVHKENIEKVPNSIKGRDNITLEICGMENIPEEDLIEHEKQKLLQSSNRDETIDSDSQDSDTSPSFNVNSNNLVAPPLPPQPPPPPPLPPQSATNLPIQPPSIHGSMPHMTAPLMMQPPPMMNPMLMPYPPPPHLMMSMNPHQMMMHGYPPQMISIPPSPQTNPSTNHPPPLMAQQIIPNQQPSKPPQPLMSSTVPALPIQPLNDNFEKKNGSSVIIEEIKKIEVPNGCKIVHPEDDISLEEYRASHHKYKYIPPQYSSPAMPNSYMNQPAGLGMTGQPPPLLPHPPPLPLAHHHHHHSQLPPPIALHQRQQHHPVHYQQHQNFNNYNPINGNHRY